MSIGIRTDKIKFSLALLAAIAALFSGFLTATFDKATKIGIGDVGVQMAIEKKQLYSEHINAIETEIDSIKKQLEAFNNIPEKSAVSMRLAKLEENVSKLSSEISGLNGVIMQSPQKALEMPMLRRDVTALKAQYESDTRSLQREIERAYDTMKWVMGTIVLGILGLAASIMVKGKNNA